VTDVEGDSDFVWQQKLNGHSRNSKYFSDKHQRFSSAHPLPPLAIRKMITVVNRHYHKCAPSIRHFRRQ
jgi:hypothetical protein